MTRSYVRMIAVAVLTAAIAFIGSTTPSHAGPSQHCVLTVVGQRANGELVTDEPVCYDTFAEAMDALGVDTSGLDTVSPSSVEAAGRLQSASSFIIGIHYDGSGGTGPSFTVSGTSCGGGWLNVPPAWNDRISSTTNGCPRIRHFWDANLTGTTQDTTIWGGNLTTLDNQTTSIQYLPS
jgi:hypothetical protein